MALSNTSMAGRIVENLSQIPGYGSQIDPSVLQAICAGIIAEIVANAEVLPNTLNNPTGQPVSTPAGAGETSAPQVIAGEGKII